MEFFFLFVMLCSSGEIEATWQLFKLSKEFHAYLKRVSEAIGHQVEDDSDDMFEF